MVDLIIAEFMKLKRNKMFLLSLLGALAVPLMIFFLLIARAGEGRTFTFEEMFTDSLMNTLLLIGLLLYAIMAAYLFSREQTENTIKTVLTLPVSRNKYLTAKFIMLFLWIAFLTFVTWFGTLVFSYIGGATDPSFNSISGYLWKFFAGGSVIYFTLTPLVFVALRTKNIVPVMVLAAIITVLNLTVAGDSFLSMIFPWTAVMSIFIEGYGYPGYSNWLPYVTVLLTGTVGLIASYVYFNKNDIF